MTARNRRTPRPARATVTVEFIPPEYRAAHNVPAEVTYYAVIERPNTDRFRVVPDTAALRHMPPDDFARLIGRIYGAHVVAPSFYLTLTPADDGTWTASDSRRCNACGQIKGIPMCCDDPATKREMIALGLEGKAPLVIRQRRAGVLS